MQDIAARSGERVPPDLSLDEIRAIFSSLAGAMDLSVVVAPVPRRGNIPVGLAGVAHGKHWSEPHVIWFPWASKRNRYEGVVSVIENRKSAFVIAGEDERFWKRLNERKLVKKLGVLDNVTLWGCECPAR